MHVHNVHSRELAAPSEEVGAVLDSLGSDHDRLWPIERWPAMPFRLEGPLAVGASSGHGLVPYSVDDYEPGRRVVFRFPPGVGMEGTHRFEVESLGPDCTRLIHTLDCTVKPKLLALWPIVRGYHHALLEDVLDKAEISVTGRRPQPQPWPGWLRVANGIEVRFGRWRGKLPPSPEADLEQAGASPGPLARACGISVPILLAGVAVIHGAWALGWRWPGGNDRAFAERVLGYGATEVPPAAATWAVAVGLLGAAAIVRAVAEGSSSQWLRRATSAISTVLLARGAISIPVDFIRGFDHIYERLDLAIYSPLCLALGAGAAVIAHRAAHPTTVSLPTGEEPEVVPRPVEGA